MKGYVKKIQQETEKILNGRTKRKPNILSWFLWNNRVTRDIAPMERRFFFEKGKTYCCICAAEAAYATLGSSVETEEGENMDI